MKRIGMRRAGAPSRARAAIGAVVRASAPLADLGHDGRTDRRGFLAAVGVALAGLGIARAMDVLVFGAVPGDVPVFFAGIAAAVVAILLSGVTVRRLHDAGRSGWALSLLLVPIVGWLAVAYLLLSPTRADVVPTRRFHAGPMRAQAIVPLLALMLGLLPAAQAFAQEAASAAVQLRQAEADVRAVDRRADDAATPADSALLQGRLATARQSAAAVAEGLAGDLASVDARIAELGPPPPGAVEAPEVRQQRAQLAAERLSLDAAVKRARLLDVEARQIGIAMQRNEAEQFGARMSRRTAMPIGPAFWGAVLGSLDEDAARIARFVSGAQRQIAAAGVGKALLLALLGAVVAAVLIGPARRGALRLGQRYLISDAPGLRLRRSAYAVWVTIIGTVMPALGVIAVFLCATVSNALPAAWMVLLQAVVVSTVFAAFVVSVFGALLMRSQPGWRIAPVADAVADRLRPLSWILAAVTFAGGLLEGFNAAVGASAAALSASKTLEAGGSLLLIAGALLALGRIRAAEVDREDIAAASAGIGALALLLWIVVLVASVALAVGYLEFSIFLVNMIVWASVVSAATYLLMNALDDAITGLFARGSRLGRTLTRGVGIRGSAIDQFGVLLSGALRVVLGFVALVLLLAPFGAGSGVGPTIEKIAAIADGIEIGGVAVSPGTIVRGVLVLLAGLALVRWFMGWLENRYLPATDLDGSGRNSVSLIARYIGTALAAIWALASLGIGVEKIALLLSALSVGIGFGLQAITQNFISGLILLAERPIKIGDLIRVGNDEGDVKRISVRSTELALGDHSTLIIPNSELITKAVLNKTLASPLGRVQIQFSVPIDADADAVQRILLDAYAAEDAILGTPAPSVFIDSIADGRIVFNSFAHVAGPRDSYGARSNVYKTVLRRLREEGIDIGSPPQRLELAQATAPSARDA